VLRFFYRKWTNFLTRTKQLALFYYFSLFIFPKVNKERPIKPRLLFGFAPIINNKYWSKAMAQANYVSHTISSALPNINSKDDFDFYIDDLFPIKGIVVDWKVTLQKLKVFNFVLNNYDILIMSFRYNYFKNTVFWKQEAAILKKYGVKTVIIPYGSDYYIYSKVIDHSLKHNLMINVASDVYNNEEKKERIAYWRDNADCILMGFMLDDAPRWDFLPVSPLCIDTNSWKRNKEENHADGRNAPVTVVHTPNHRGFKGTEFIFKAIDELKEEGLKINFIVIEKLQNTEVKQILLEEADILIEQVIFTGYALSGVEGLSAGLPVVSNLDREDITQVFRRYSYLNECPIVSGTPENIKETIRYLIQNPDLRNQLGRAGREYVQKYHSYHAFQLFFEQIFKKIYHDQLVDSMNYFNPQDRHSYNNSRPIIKHPLINNRIAKAN
jgi:glycosyltransferase involved in cell wall biosynthesis